MNLKTIQQKKKRFVRLASPPRTGDQDGTLAARHSTNPLSPFPRLHRQGLPGKALAVAAGSVLPGIQAPRGKLRLAVVFFVVGEGLDWRRRVTCVIPGRRGSGASSSGGVQCGPGWARSGPDL
jgi:hypothetical protein